jgi:hypothetical protein
VGNQLEQMLIKQALEELSPQSYMRELMKLTSGDQWLETFSSQAQMREFGAILGYDGLSEELIKLTSGMSQIQELKATLEFGSLLEELKKQELKTLLGCSTSDQALVEAFSSQAQLNVLRLPEPQPESHPTTPPRHTKSPTRIEITGIVGPVLQDLPQGKGMPIPYYEVPANASWSQTESYIYIRIPRTNIITLSDSSSACTDDLDEAPGRRELQIQAILEKVDAKGWDRHAIPKGGKAMLRRELCKSFPKLFSYHGFNHAWSDASEAKRLQVANIDLYRP